MDIEITCSPGNGRLIAYLHEHAHVLSSRFEEHRVTFRLLIEDKLMQKLRMLDDTIQMKETTGSN